MRRLFGICIILYMGGSTMWAEEEDNSLKLLYFTASWCGPCQMMKQETWPNPLVEKALQAYDFQTIDVDEAKDLAKKWSVRSMPTYIITDPSNKIELMRMSGFMDAYRMSTWLKDADHKARQTLGEIIEAREIAEKNWREMASLTQDNTTGKALQDAQKALYTLLEHRGELLGKQRKALDVRLNTIAKSHPHYIADGILHKDLQVRAHIARALAAYDISFNPWASEEKRSKDLLTFKNAALSNGRSGER